MSKAAAEEAELEDFSTFALDPRLTKVLEKQNIVKPTLIQEKAIPLALAGKDILAKAKTGSGKTLAYLLPILHKLLSFNEKGATKCLILVPTKELARQVGNSCGELLYYCHKIITVVNLAGDESLQLQKSLLSSSPTVIITTPSRILPHLDNQSVFSISVVEFLVVDEADLVLSFGYSADLNRLLTEFLPKTAQSFLMSATLSPEIENLKRLFLRNPVTLKLEDGDDPLNNNLHQYVITCEPDDKYLLMYVTLKLKLLTGKILIFTNDTDRSFKLKLFLEQFGVKSCILNPELPVVSRHHIVDEYNRGVYDIIIATDATGLEGNNSKGKSKRVKTEHKESGVARGVDFKRVDVVINFDVPQKVDSYVHRVGRTARGSNTGTAITFLANNDKDDQLVFAGVKADQLVRGNEILSHDFDLKQLEGFRYRCNDALRSVTKSVIKAARLRAIKDEIAKSEKLKGFFEERPKDLQLLRHDGRIGDIPARPHLKHVPEYLLVTDHHLQSEGKKMKIDSPLPQTLPSDNNGKFSNNNKKLGGKFTKRRGKDVLRSIKKTR